MFKTVIDGTDLTVLSVLFCALASLAVGLVFAAVYRFTEKRYSKSFLVTLLILPLAVQTVIMMVNGNLGAGVAVAGAFALVRFRSAPGTAKEICLLFCVMACGLATGMGYLTFAFLMCAIIAVAFIAVSLTPWGRENGEEKIVKVLMPENLDYDEAFAEVFAENTTKAELFKVKTVELGSLYQLTYAVKLKKGVREKKLIDELRLRNGNLTVICSKGDIGNQEL